MIIGGGIECAFCRRRRNRWLLSGGIGAAGKRIHFIKWCKRTMLTIMIAARNAAGTIERAISSCLEEDAKILLVDDHSTDDTVLRAKRIAEERLHVINAPDPGGVPIARQAGLAAVQTPFAAWLDADDGWLPGRKDRLLRELKQGCDVVSDRVDLYDGPTGRFLRHLEAPPFLRRESVPVRLFERNYLPGDTQVGFRVEAFRAAGGYDSRVYGPESFDLLLRAITRGATFVYLKESGYRMYAYPGSVSRDLPRLRAAVALALRKHPFEAVRGLCLAAGYPPRVAAWVLVSMAIFREEFAVAIKFLEQASPVDADPQTILEPNGPLPLPEGWRRAFYQGTLLLLIGGNDHAAKAELRRAETILPTAEGANNLGVAQKRLGRLSAAAELFTAALQRFPEYLDARLNLVGDTADHITVHPLRRQFSRFEYGG